MFTIRYRRLVTATAAIAAVALLATGCTATPTPDNTSSGGTWQGSKSEVYQQFDFAPTNGFFLTVFDGFKAAADQLGVSAEHSGGTAYDTTTQVQDFQQFVAKGPAGVAVAPFDSDAFTAPINAVVDGGAPVVTFDVDAPNSKRSGFLGTDTIAGGEEIADAFHQFYPNGAKIGVILIAGSSTFQIRLKAMQDKIASDYPNLKVVATADGGADETSAATATQNMLQANPDITAVIGLTSFLAVGAYQAVKEAGVKVDVSSFDITDPTLDYIKDGKFTFAIGQTPWAEGYWALIQLYAEKHKLVVPFPNGDKAGISPLPQFVDTGIHLVTKDNVDAFVR